MYDLCVTENERGFDTDGDASEYKHIYEMDASASEIWLDEPLHSAVRHAHTKSTESFKDIHGIRPDVIHKVLHILFPLCVRLLDILDNLIMLSANNKSVELILCFTINYEFKSK